MKDKGIRLVIAHVLEEVEAESRYHVLVLFDEGTFYHTVGRSREGESESRMTVTTGSSEIDTVAAVSVTGSSSPN